MVETRLVHPTGTCLYDPALRLFLTDLHSKSNLLLTDLDLDFRWLRTRLSCSAGVRDRSDFCNPAPSILVHYMRDQIDGSSAFVLDLVESNPSRTAHCELCQTP